MPPRVAADWMWGEAVELLMQAERLHGQFFRLAGTADARPAWEPPVDVFEDDDELVVHVAMPGVAAERIEAICEPAELAGARRASAADHGDAAPCAAPRDPVWLLRATGPATPSRRGALR